MNYTLVKMDQLSGSQASIYSLYIEEEQQTLFDRFINENKLLFKSELKDIVLRLNTIANKTGARAQFFKEHEGKPADHVCALYDQPGSRLRLYCIRLGYTLVIIGSGGFKSKTIRALQEDTILDAEQKIMVNLSAEILKRQREKDIWYTYNYMDLEGDLDFEF